MLQEALQLLRGAVGGRQEFGRVEGTGLQALDVVELRDHLAPEPLDSPAYAYRVAALEPQPDPIGLAKHPRRKLARAVAELDRQVRAAVAGGQPRSEEHTSELQSHSDLVCRL